MGEIRERLSAALATIEDFGRGHFDLRLRPPATAARIAEAEAELGARLPDDLRELYLLHDGQDQGMMSARLFGDLPFAPLRRAVKVCRDEGAYLLEVELDDPGISRTHDEMIWFPFAVFTWEYKEALWADLYPPEGRPHGQVVFAGPWALPAGYIAPSVLAVLETYAEGIRQGRVGITPYGSMRTWGFGPTSLSLEQLDGAPTVDVPPRYGVDVSRQLPRTVLEVGDLSGIRALSLRRATTLEGIDNYEGNVVALLDSPELVIDRLVDSGVSDLYLEGGIPRLNLPLPKIHRLHLSINSPADLAILELMPALNWVSVDLGDTDPNDYDWSSSPALGSVWLRGGRISSLDWAGALPNLRVLQLREPRELRVSGAPRGARLFVEVLDAGIPDDIDAVADWRPPMSLAGPYEWFRRLEGVAAAGLWTGVLDHGDDSTWAELTAQNWAVRTEVMEAMGLPLY